MAQAKNTNLLSVILSEMEDPEDYRTWEGVTSSRVRDADRIVVYYPDGDYYKACIYKDKDRDFDLRAS